MIRIFTKIIPDWNASGYYRQLQPLAIMSRYKLADVTIDRYDSRTPPQAIAEAMAYADICWFYQPMSHIVVTSIEETHKWKSYWRTESEWTTPVSFCTDTDDDLFNISPLNAAFRTLGVRVDDKELQVSADPNNPTTISTKDAKGDPFVLWKDGTEGFDIARNKATLATYAHTLAASAMVTCSTPRSADYVKKWAGSPNTVVIPNCANFDDYDMVELADKGKEVRMLWQGSSTHLEDLHPLRASITSLLEKHPNLTLYIWGAQYIDPLWNPDQIKFLPWADYREYKLRLAMLNHDINIAPLTPTTFNLSRSAIKVYESGALHRPIPTVAQRTGAYADEMINDETALLFDTPEEFEAQVTRLIESRELRDTIAHNCKDWLRANRDPVHWAQVLLTQFTHLRKIKADVLGPPPAEEIVLESVPPDDH